MALIQCPACGGTCSDQATKCPHCGAVLNSENPIQQLPKVDNNKQRKSETTFSASKSLMLIVATFGVVLAVGSILEMFFGLHGSTENNGAMQFFGLISSFLGMILAVLSFFIQETKSRIATGVVGVFFVGFCDLVKRIISLIAFIVTAIENPYLFETPYSIISYSIANVLWMFPLTVVSILAVYHIINER